LKSDLNITVIKKYKMSLQVVTVESVSGSEVVGVYLTEKLAKVAVQEYVERGEVSYKKKLVKKDSEDVKKLMYLEDSKDADKKSVYVTSVPFVMPVTGKVKKVKDPNAPRKALSGFMLFSNERRTQIKDSNPDATFGEVGRLVGGAWKSLTDKQREVYTGRSESDKQRYLSEMSAYTLASNVPVVSVEEPVVSVEEPVVSVEEPVGSAAPVKKARAKKAVV
jgi:leucyl-tRNA synthetase